MSLVNMLKNMNKSTRTEGDYSPIQNNNGQGNNIINYIMPMSIAVSPYKIKMVLDILYDNIDSLFKINDEEKKVSKRKNYSLKNELTGMSEQYFKQRIKPHLYLEKSLNEFLKKNSNEREKKKYNIIVRDINSKFAAYSRNFRTFDEAFDNMVTTFENSFMDKFSTQEVCIRESELIEVLFSYMYFICDIPDIPKESDNDEIKAR
ncbi:hypothetical protein Z957_05245 [Clostridium sp. K25]|uniref:ABC-three component system protein n=1 Tax=Clostridium sp. K25 TaxID=1443109 RepID=UPI0004D6C87B|nr:ABC-three component system protein [Clostridium sp. K25]KEI09309.1 hypothetical protein Z957_05245 [Clostridium sp. K25]